MPCLRYHHEPKQSCWNRHTENSGEFLSETECAARESELMTFVLDRTAVFLFSLNGDWFDTEKGNFILKETSWSSEDQPWSRGGVGDLLFRNFAEQPEVTENIWRARKEILSRFSSSSKWFGCGEWLETRVFPSFVSLNLEFHSLTIFSLQSDYMLGLEFWKAVKFFKKRICFHISLCW